jgi:hypothetical protein
MIWLAGAMVYREIGVVMGEGGSDRLALVHNFDKALNCVVLVGHTWRTGEAGYENVKGFLCIDNFGAGAGAGLCADIGELCGFGG